ncbi:MAG: hypothetical protein H7A51_04785 [Akkermansiaceae bacterium]|nr:hypothetical protein [Akkermansiaceae bacterium]
MHRRTIDKTLCQHGVIRYGSGEKAERGSTVDAEVCVVPDRLQTVNTKIRTIVALDQICFH